MASSAGEEQMQNQELNLENALQELDAIVQASGDMYHKLKKIKFDYLIRTCELFSRIDMPSILMENVRKDVHQAVPTVKKINDMDI